MHELSDALLDPARDLPDKVFGSRKLVEGRSYPGRWVWEGERERERERERGEREREREKTVFGIRKPVFGGGVDLARVDSRHTIGGSEPCPCVPGILFVVSVC